MPSAGSKHRRDSYSSTSHVKKVKPETARPIEGIRKERHAIVQVAMNALEIWTRSGGARSHSIQLVLDDDKLFFWYFDAAGMIKSEDPLNIKHDFAKVAAALIALASCDPFQLGALPTSVAKPLSPQAYRKDFPFKSLEKFTVTIPVPVDGPDVRFTFGRLLYVQYALVGRRTVVYECPPSPKTENRLAVIKISYQNVKRSNEWELIAHAPSREAGVGNLPRVHAHRAFHDLKSIVGSMRKRCHAIVPDLEKFRMFENKVIRIMVCEQYTSLVERLVAHPGDLIEMIKQITNCGSDSNHIVCHTDIVIM